MKDVIGLAVVLIGLAIAGNSLKSFHDSVRKAALIKASKGLPSLTQMTKELQGRKAPKLNKNQ